MTKYVIKKGKNKTQRNKIITSQSGVIKNALNLFAKRTIISNSWKFRRRCILLR